MSRLFRFRKRDRGSAVLEFALGSSVLFVILGGVADLSRMFFYARIVANSCRAGVQYGMYSATNAQSISGMQNAALGEPGTLAGMTAAAQNYCQCPSSTSPVGCASTCSNGKAPSNYIQVTSSYPFTTVVTWPNLPSAFTISSTATMRVQ